MKCADAIMLRSSQKRLRVERSDADEPALGGHPERVFLTEQIKDTSHRYYKGGKAQRLPPIGLAIGKGRRASHGWWKTLRFSTLLLIGRRLYQTGERPDRAFSGRSSTGRPSSPITDPARSRPVKCTGRAVHDEIVSLNEWTTQIRRRTPAKLFAGRGVTVKLKPRFVDEADSVAIIVGAERIFPQVHTEVERGRR